MTIQKKVSIICSLILIIAIGSSGIYNWISKESINATTLFYLFLGIGFLFHSLTWGDMYGKHEAKKDKTEIHITLLSSKISYYVLLGLMILVLILTERVTAMDDIKNIPLVLVIGIAMVTMPITEFIIAKKHR